MIMRQGVRLDVSIFFADSALATDEVSGSANRNDNHKYH